MAVTISGTWVPDPGTNLDRQSETLAINQFIYFDVPPWTPPDQMFGQPIAYAAWWTSVRVPSFVTLTTSSSGVTVAGPNVTGLAPIAIDYMLDKVSYRVLKFDDLPAANHQQQLYNYAAPSTNKAYATFNVRVTLQNQDTGETTTLDQGYTIEVTIDYTSGRDRLVSEVNLRR